MALSRRRIGRACAQAPPLRYSLLLIFWVCILFFYYSTSLLFVFPPSKSQLATKPSESIAEEDDPSFVHFTHVFSSFKGKSPAQRFEYDAVMASWEAALKEAKLKGIRVEYVDAILPEDLHSVPAFASETVMLKHRAQMVGGLKVPLVGEVFKAGSAGKGKWLVYTNSDIAVVPEFYVKLWKLLTTDAMSETNLPQIFEKLVDYKVKCLKAQASKRSRLCDADSKVLFENLGGFGELYDQISEDVALYIMKQQLRQALPSWACERSADIINGLCSEAARLIKKSGAGDLLSRRKKMAENMYEVILGRPTPKGSIQRIISSWLPNGVPVLVAEAVSSRHFSNSAGWKRRPVTAMTITRLDVPFERESELKTGQIMQTIAAKGKIHPGNDCFVMPRAHVPKVLTSMTHPVGLRPWGQWVPDIFRWDDRFVWRRIIGRPQDPYTFHVGMGLWGGAGEDKWKARAKGEKELILFLAAQWYRISDHQFAKSFKVPPYCGSISLWREEHYCHVIQNGNCRGTARLGCAQYQHPKSRDVLIYLQSCSALGTAQRGLPQPLCDFCNFLRSEVSSGSASSTKVGGRNRMFTCLQQDVTDKYIFAVSSD